MLSPNENQRVRGHAVQAVLIAIAVVAWGVAVLCSGCASRARGEDSPSAGPSAPKPGVVSGGGAHAQPRAGASVIVWDDDPEAAVRSLLTAFVAEADFDAPADHAAIGHVLVRRATVQGVPVEELAQRYVSVFKPRVVSARAHWLRGLTTECTPPPAWPRNARWSRAACLNVVARARALLSGDLPDPCHGRAQHWGAPYGVDHARALRAGWERVDCGNTANAFWR